VCVVLCARTHRLRCVVGVCVYAGNGVCLCRCVCTCLSLCGGCRLVSRGWLVGRLFLSACFACMGRVLSVLLVCVRACLNTTTNIAAGGP